MNLGARPVLLVLDNCEHLLDASAALVDAVLDAGARARILVTSREPLRVDGEAVHRIGSLGPESAELFVERAVRRGGPGRRRPRTTRASSTCASGWTGSRWRSSWPRPSSGTSSLPELVDRLDDRLTLLVGGRPKAGHRHSALTATIEWSHRLLSDDARELFDRLGVFPASFDLDAVQAVAGELGPGHGDQPARRPRRQEPGGARPRPEQRYRLLETIRLFAALAPRRLRATRRGDRAAFVATWSRGPDDAPGPDLAVRLPGRHGAVTTWTTSGWPSRRASTRGDLTAAVDIALGLSTLWRNAVVVRRGPTLGGRPAARDLSPPDRLWTLILAADVGLGSGDPRMMREATAEATALSAQARRPAARAVITTIYDGMVQFIDAGLGGPAPRGGARPGPCSGRTGARTAGPRLPRGRSCGCSAAPTGWTRRSDALIEADSGGRLRPLHRHLGRQPGRRWSTATVPRQRQLMDAQLADLMASGLRENWLTHVLGGAGPDRRRRGLPAAAAAGPSAGRGRGPRRRGRLRAGARRTPLPAATSGSGPRSCWAPPAERSSATPPASSTTPCSATSWCGPGSTRTPSRRPPCAGRDCPSARSSTNTGCDAASPGGPRLGAARMTSRSGADARRRRARCATGCRRAGCAPSERPRRAGSGRRSDTVCQPGAEQGGYDGRCPEVSPD